MDSVIKLKLSQSSNLVPSIQSSKSLKSKQPVKAKSPVNFEKALTCISHSSITVDNGTDYGYLIYNIYQLMNYKIDMEISPSLLSLDLTDIQDIQNPS